MTLKYSIKSFITLCLALLCTSSFAQKKSHNISGFIAEKGSKESIIGVSIFILENLQVTQSNNYGFYSINTSLDTLTLMVSMVGYEKQAFKLKLEKDINLNIELVSSNTLKEATVESQRMGLISEDLQMSIHKIGMDEIKQIPSLLGEKDVLKVLQLLPGVQKGSEGNSGLYVRGGGPDQNLIILDDAPVYNAFHLFGFYSLFNGDALKSVELTKGGFPARYGGRLSSVLEMNMKDGNKEQLKGEAGIGLISSRLTLEGPINKTKSSFLISGRRTYIDALIYPFLPPESRGGYYFYDLNTKLNFEIDSKNKLYLSGYFGRDKFYAKENYDGYKSNFGLYWGNGTGTVRWNHVFNSKLFSNTSFIYSTYNLNVFIKDEYDGDFYEQTLSSGIRDISLKQDFDFAFRERQIIKTGFIITQHRFTPSATTIKDSALPEENLEEKDQVDAMESALYIEDHIQHSLRWKSSLGLRFSQFYQNKKTYLGLEPRISTAFQIKEDLAIKASYALMNQYIHLLSSTGVGLPTDLWVPSTNTVRPQRSNQVALGIAKDFIPQSMSLSIEGYYKYMHNIIAYKEGATFLAVDEPGPDGRIVWEDNITSGQGWSYGTEFLLKKNSDKFNGWIGYTLSWTQLQFDELNFGKKYFARYDRRHDISIVGIYKFTEDITLSTTWVYGTGNAITLPKAEYTVVIPNPGNSNGNQIVTDYGDRNSFRMEAYHRMDISIQFHKQLKRSIRTVELSVYNVYNRRNPYFYYVGTNEAGNVRTLKKISLFPILPSISWTYKF